MKTILYEEGYPLALRATYLQMIWASIGSHQYRKLFVARPDGIIVDVIGDGDLACEYYVSSIITLCGLSREGVHTTVDRGEQDMIRSGWFQTTELIPGAVLIWARKLCTDGIKHRHIGFLLDGETAVSNCSTARSPQNHHYTFGTTDGKPNRAIEAIYMHPKLAV